MTSRFLRFALGLGMAAGLAGCTVETEPPTPSTPIASVEPPKPQPVATPGASASPSPAKAGAPALLSPKTASQADVASLLSRAQAAIQGNNFPSAVRFLDELLLVDPQNRDALSLMARAAQSQAMQLQRPQNSPLYLKSGDAMRRLRDLKVELTDDERNFLPVVFYNEACTLTLMGDLGRAIKVLTDAFDSGFDRVELLDSDPELEPLRRLTEFQSLQRRQERRVIEANLAATKPFAFDFKLPDLDGKNRTFAELKGDVTIIDIWGTWCLPCRKEVPHLVDLAQRYKDRGLRVIGLNYEQEIGEVGAKAARDFVKEFGIIYPCVLGDSDTQRQIPTFQGYPTTLFLDHDGKVRLQITGYQSLSTLETAVEALLALNKTGAARPESKPAAAQPQPQPRPAPAPAQPESKPAPAK